MDVCTSMFDSKPPQQTSSNRGLRLTLVEEQYMVGKCLQRMSTCLVSEYPKRFWETMTAYLLRHTGREYSWQSCKRRMMRILDSYRMHHELVFSLTSHIPLQAPITLTEAEFSNLGPEIIRMLDDFFKRILNDRSIVGFMDESGDREKVKEEHQPTNPKEQRIQTWLQDIPLHNELEDLRAERAEIQARVRRNFPRLFAENEQKYRPPPSARSRSRSPSRAERKHRPRSRSPLARHQEIPVVASGALPCVKPEEQGRKPRLPLPSYETQHDPSPENCDPDTIQYSEGFHDAAMQFCERHMHPLIRSLTAHNPVLQNESLDLADSACRAMFESVVSAATKHITDNFDLKPRRT